MIYELETMIENKVFDADKAENIIKQIDVNQEFVAQKYSLCYNTIFELFLLVKACFLGTKEEDAL